MLTLPDGYFTLIAAFAPIFSKRIWQPAQVLLTGGHPGTGQADGHLRAARHGIE